MSDAASYRRVQFGMVAAGYAGVIAVSTLWVVQRYLGEKRNPADFNGGMAAGGDWFLELIIVAMLLVPTFFLALILRNSEEAYTKFARVLFGFGLTMPASMALMAIPAVGQTNSLLGSLCLYRIFGFPMTTIGLAGYCVLAKFKRPRRLILYAALIEIASMVVLFTLTSGKF